MHRGVLLLPWLAIAALAPCACAEDAIASDGKLDLPKSTLVRGGSRSARSGNSGVVPAANIPAEAAVESGPYIAQHPNPGEPLGFSGSRFAPQSEAVVDPAMTSGGFDPHVAPFHESPDPFAPAPAVSSGDWLRDGRWYTEQSAIYMSRTASVKNTLRLAEDRAFGIVPIDALDVKLDLGFEPGLRSTLGRYLGRDRHNRIHSVEFTFMGLTHWQFGQSIAAQMDASIVQVVDPGADVPVYDDSDFQGFDQTSDFNSYELNYRVERRLGRDRMVYTRDSTWVREATPSLLCSAFAGLRVAIVNEGFDWIAINDVTGNGSYAVVTHNNMVGPQVGADLFYEHAYWRAGIRGQAGALVNWASQSSTVRIEDPNGTPLVVREEFVEDHTLAFVGGLSFIGEYRFRPSFGLRVSYDLLFATDLALAQNQITFFPSTPPVISDSHSLFFQGVSLGFEWYR